MSNSGKALANVLIYEDVNTLGIGDLVRYKIKVDRDQLRAQGIDQDELYIYLKNKESALLRPVYLTGPYAFYFDIRPHNYDENEKFEDDREMLQFCSDLRPDQSFIGFLRLNKNSRVGDTEIYSWTVDTISQICVTALPKVDFMMRIGTVKKSMKRNGEKVTPTAGFSVEKLDTESLWSLPPKYSDKPVHLVILTHGIFSNVGCDMLYIKDKIEQVANHVRDDVNPNVVVRGCMDNMGKSAFGIHYLGVRVAKYIIKTVTELRKKYTVDKISFIGHSLGGPTQAMAIHYLAVKHPDFFDIEKGLKPINFITLASPFIGITVDYPAYVTLALELGALGITGRDLTLKKTPLVSKDGLGLNNYTTKRDNKGLKMLLEVLPQKPAKPILEAFVNRTLYANVVHDGIVPLRTAALLYLDWRSLSKVKKLKEKEDSYKSIPSSKSFDSSTGNSLMDPNSPTPPSSFEMSESPSEGKEKGTQEIPIDKQDKKAALQWLLPQSIVHNNRYSNYRRLQTVEGEEMADADEEFMPPSEASTFQAALQVLMAPDPSQKYLKDPASRQDAIVHDKLYTPNEIPEPHYEDRSVVKKIVYINERMNRVQERIARAWQDTMTWRKVLVKIKPDSHNNIIVRRRFVNLFGNVAVDHLVVEHFGTAACERYAVN